MADNYIQNTFLRPRNLLASSGIVITLLLSLWLTIGSVPKAHAISAWSYCNKVWLGPLGNWNDRCSSGIAGDIFTTTIISYNHSACQSTLNIFGEVSAAWKCTAGPNSQRTDGYLDHQWRRPIMRNNTSNDFTQVDGSANCESGCEWH